MLDRLFDFLLQAWTFLVPWAILEQYQQGVVLRLGKYQRTIGPGFHWLIPFNIDVVIADSVVTSTARLNPQSLTTEDGVSVVVAAVVTSEVRDIRKLLLACEDKDQALIDTCFGVIARAVCATPWDKLHTPEFQEELTKAARKRGFRFGIEVESVALTDLTKARSIRLWSGQ